MFTEARIITWLPGAQGTADDAGNGSGNRGLNLERALKALYGVRAANAAIRKAEEVSGKKR